jgi:hypothetical protein
MPGEEQERTAGGYEEVCRREQCEATMIVRRRPANWRSSHAAIAIRRAVITIRAGGAAR